MCKWPVTVQWIPTGLVSIWSACQSFDVRVIGMMSWEKLRLHENVWVPHACFQWIGLFESHAGLQSKEICVSYSELQFRTNA